MKQHKELKLILITFIVSVLIAYAIETVSANTSVVDLYKLTDTSTSIFPQESEGKSDKPIEVTKLYRDEKLVGIISDGSKLNEMFDKVYEEEYKAEFPDSKLGFIDDLILVKELSFNHYEDRDDEIFQYLYDEKLFAIEVNQVTFSNGAIIYVKNIDDFNKARDTFIRNFTDDKTFDAMKNNRKIESIKDYGTHDVNVEVEETVQISKGLTSKENILMNESDVLTFLSYGYNPKVEIYEVQPYDTIAGIAWHKGMDANQIKYINSDIIKDVNQVLEVGSKLRVSKFNSPFTVKITRERMTSEVVYPESTIYESDPELSEGKEVVDVVEQNGKRDVVYEDVIVNGAPKSSEEIRTQVTKEPIRGKVRYGTKVEPRIGSGNYRWPLDNANISCVYGNSCYYNHNGTDFVLNGGGFGPIYAVDRGVVSETVSGCFEGNYGCGSGWGNHIVIDHGNGYTTLYAHMATGPYFNVGDLVKRGDNIGYMGMTGTTYGPHVHLEFRYHGVRVDPCTVMGC